MRVELFPNFTRHRLITHTYHFSEPPLVLPPALMMLKYSPLGSFFSNSNLSC